MAGDRDGESSLTCTTCQVVFATPELQRDHYRSDWHTYNLKRKVADLKPVTAQIFHTKVLALKEAKQREEDQAKQTFLCRPCSKSFSSQNAYDNHVRSNKHKEVAVKWHLEVANQDSASTVTIPSSADISSDDEASDTNWEDAEDDEGSIPVGTCLFCSVVAAAPGPSAGQAGLKHMYLVHGFFLPDVEYCVDVDGMLVYLGMKAGAGNVCLFCSRHCASLDAVQKHMRDKCHCRVKHDTSDAMLEYADFYDYSSSYPEDKNDEEQGADIEPHNAVLAVDEDWQLVLPSGATVGHRTLQRYYRQRLKPEKQVALVNVQKGRDSVQAVLTQYKALGWTGALDKKSAERKAKDLRFIKRLSAKKSLQLGLKTNKLQKHFKRDDIML